MFFSVSCSVSNYSFNISHEHAPGSPSGVSAFVSHVFVTPSHDQIVVLFLIRTDPRCVAAASVRAASSLAVRRRSRVRGSRCELDGMIELAAVKAFVYVDGRRWANLVDRGQATVGGDLLMKMTNGIELLMTPRLMMLKMRHIENAGSTQYGKPRLYKYVKMYVVCRWVLICYRLRAH